MKYLYVLVTIVLANSFGHSQNAFNCLSHETYLEEIKNNPEFKMNQDMLERETEILIKNRAANKTTSATYIIPIVFHVIHTGGSGNISSAQIVDQVAILNREFKRQQADTALTPWAFKALAASFDVEFRLATKDPNGDCTNGIDRVYNSLSTCSNTWDEVKSLSYWPSNRYLNIWLVESMHYPGNNSCVGGGYSAFPGGPANKDGVVIRGDLIGSIGTAATNSSWGNFKGRYLVHELGHWFNLIHIWGDNNCGNDFVNDTPPAVIDNSGCPSFPHNPNNACGSNANGEMYTNYMDYTNGSCLNMFSAGQVVRMTAAINSSASGKNNLWTVNNLNFTGTNDPYIYPAACAAEPDVLPYGALTVCQGDSARFTDYSYGGLSTSRLWNFSGQPASSLTDSIVKVKYNNTGVYSIALTKNYQTLSATTTFTNKVYVIPNTVIQNYVMPFTDSLESPLKFANEWTIINKNNDLRTWQQLNSTAYSGNGCVGIMNFKASAPSVDEMISPPYNFSSAITATLNFQIHSAMTATNNTDRLQVFMSADCGSQWYLLQQKSGTLLRSVPGLLMSSHTPPAGSSEWRSESIDLPAIWDARPVRFKFTFTSGGGNNIFIDDINLAGEYQTTAIKKQISVTEISVFPNPAGQLINIEYITTKAEQVKIDIFDVLGKLCVTQSNDNSSTGKKTSAIDIKELKSGVYFIHFTRDGIVSETTKFIKEN